MGVHILDPFGYNSSNHRILKLLGLKRLPVQGLPEVEIQGVRVYVKPSTSGGTRATRECKHRIIAICTCGRHVPVGRLHQHKCKTEDEPSGYKPEAAVMYDGTPGSGSWKR